MPSPQNAEDVEVVMDEKPEKVTGGCLCGAVRYEAEVFLQNAFYRHCRMCQKSAGGPAEIGVYVKPGSFRPF